MRKMKNSFFTGLIAACLTISAANLGQAQTTATTDVQYAIRPVQTSDLGKSAETSKIKAQQLLQLQDSEVSRLSASVEQLRQLYTEGLIARLELEKAEQDLAAAKAEVWETQNQIANSDRLVAEIKKAEELARVKPLVKRTLLPLKSNNTSTILRSAPGSWSIGNLSVIQRFFSKTFGRALPTSAIGQSATHNRMGWDHRNAVDVGLHPDSAEGRELIGFLQVSGIPFLAFRSAIPGVATGPHIHIGSPSHRIS